MPAGLEGKETMAEENSQVKDLSQLIQHSKLHTNFMAGLSMNLSSRVAKSAYSYFLANSRAALCNPIVLSCLKGLRLARANKR